MGPGTLCAQSPAPVALFVYARPDHTARTLAALSRSTLCARSEIYIFCDGHKGSSDLTPVTKVRNLVENYNAFGRKTVMMRPKNIGLARSIIDGVSTVIAARGSVVVIEDDIIVGTECLEFFNEALAAYRDEARVMHISGYVPGSVARPSKDGTFLFRIPFCWGWATWEDRWRRFCPDGQVLLRQLEAQNLVNRFDIEGTAGFSRMLKKQVAGEIDSWFVRWYATTLLASGLAIYPWNSLVTNIGNDGSGTNCRETDVYATQISQKPQNLVRGPISEDSEAVAAFRELYKKVYTSRLEKLLHSLGAALGFSRSKPRS